MSDRFKEFGYEITTDPTFMDKQNAITPELRMELEPLHHQIEKQKGSKKSIAKLLKLIKKYPRNPQLKNYLTVAYNLRGDRKKTQEINRWIISEHPDYLYGKLNLAAEYFENKEYEKMTEAMGELMEINDLYPDRKVFHLAEVTGFYRMSIMYFTAIGNLEAAESRYKIIEEIAPDHPDTMDALRHMMSVRMEANQKRWEEEEKAKIKVETASAVNEPQTTKKPNFANEEINLLYENGLLIEKAILRKILSIPRETLISDLKSTLHDMLARYEYFKSYADSNDYDEETMSFGIHSWYLLGELKAEESLDAVLNVLRQGEEFLDFWFGDFLTECIWEPLYYIANTQPEKLKQFVLEPAIYTYARSEIFKVMKQIALHQPERENEVLLWFKDVAHAYTLINKEANIIDSDAIAFLVCEIISINGVGLLPEIEKLFELGYVSENICGSLKDVQKDIGEPPKIDFNAKLLNTYDRYEKITTTWAGYTEEEDDDDDLPDIDFPPVTEVFPELINPKVGRNDPCPCGSGKKHKKCCLNK